MKFRDEDDRTARYLILRRYEHKDGGYFWSVKDWVDGMNDTPESALLEALDGQSEAKRYAVLDWRTAKFFRTESVVRDDG